MKLTGMVIVELFVWRCESLQLISMIINHSRIGKQATEVSYSSSATEADAMLLQSLKAKQYSKHASRKVELGTREGEKRYHR